MKRDGHDEAVARTAAPSFESATTGERDDLPAWQPIGGGYWLPQRVRGSNRGRALG